MNKLAKKLFLEVIPYRQGLKVRESAKNLISVINRISYPFVKDIPRVFEIETNRKCTRSCDYCPRPGNSDVELSSETFESLIDQMKFLGFKGLMTLHQYNEPLTDERIFSFIQYTHKNLPNADIDIYSNGDLLDRKVANELYSSGANRLIVTMHEPISDENVSKLEEMKSFGKKYVLYSFRKKDKDRPLSTRGGLNLLEEVKLNKFCYYTTTMVIRADGESVLCINDALEKHKFGNVNEQGIMDIWNSENYRNVRKELRNGNLYLDICKSCGFEKFDY